MSFPLAEFSLGSLLPFLPVVLAIFLPMLLKDWLDRILKTPDQARGVLVACQCALIFAAVGLMLITPDDHSDMSGLLSGFVTGVAFLVAVGFTLNKYLAPGDEPKPEDAGKAPDLEVQVRQMLEKVEKLTSGTDVNDAAAKDANSLQMHWTKLSEDIQAKAGRFLKEDLNKSLLAELQAGLLPESREDRFREWLAGLFHESRERLQKEIAALGKRANLNLIIGSVATLAALGVLWWVSFEFRFETKTSSNAVTKTAANAVANSTAPNATSSPAPASAVPTPAAVEYTAPNWAAVIANAVPRVTLGLFIQVFAFFFLRLYKSTLEEIKYYQNELTTLHCYHTSLVCCTSDVVKSPNQELQRMLMEVDRNKVLREANAPKSTKSAKESIETAKQFVGLAKEVMAVAEPKVAARKPSALKKPKAADEPKAE